MAYEKQTWQNGDVITETKLNHMEDGIANNSGNESNAFVVNGSLTGNTIVLDKTWEQIYQEIEDGKIGFIIVSDDGPFAIMIITEVDPYQDIGRTVTALSANAIETFIHTYIAQNPSDYPSETLD